MAFSRKIDLSEMKGVEEILVKQRDANSRTIVFELNDGGTPLDLSDKTVTLFAKRKGDRALFGTECSISSNKATVVLQGNMLSKNDILLCELSIIGEDYTISTPTFVINVMALIRDDDYIEGTDEFSLFESVMQNALDLPDAQAINEAAQRLEDALNDLDQNLLVDGSVSINKTDFFDYDYYVSSANIFDEDYIREYFAIPPSDEALDNIFTTDFIKVEPSATYFFSRTDLNHFETPITLFWYDSTPEYLSSTNISTDPEDRVITVPSDAEYMQFSMYTDEVNFAEHIIFSKVNSDATFSNDYIPEYEAYTLERVATISDPELLAMFEERDNCSVAAANDYTDLCIASAMGDGSVTAEKLADNSVSTSKIADSAVTGDKIADGTITADKIAGGVLTNGIDGVGIESISQPVVSTEDNGENVITIRLTNGETFSFRVRNGSQGLTGEIPVIQETPVNYGGNEITLLEKGLFIGDSSTEGWFDYNDEDYNRGHILNQNICYPEYLSKMTGIKTAVAGRSGFSLKMWYDFVKDTSSFEGLGIRFAVIFLGIMDANINNGWTSESETALENIVTKLQNEIPGVKLFILTPPMYFLGTNFDSVAEGIRQKADDLGLYLIDLRTYWTDCNVENWQTYGVDVGSHFNAYGQFYLAKILKSYISYIIKNNIDDFKNIQFVGTNLSYTVRTSN